MRVIIQSNQSTLPDSEPWDCGLSKIPRMVVWQPAADLAPFLSGYHLYAVGPNGGQPNRGAFEPAWASLRIAVAGGTDWRVRPMRGDWLAPGQVSLFGPSSGLVWSESGAGVLIGAGIRPRGWLRLFAAPARDNADRIDRSPALNGIRSSEISSRFRVLQSDSDVPRIFDTLFRDVLLPPVNDEEAVAIIEGALVDPEIRSVAQLRARAGFSLRKVQRMADRAFGFPPKLLLRRARFLRSLHALRAARKGDAASVIDPHYTDHSHFIRDSRDFLGMSPQAFLDIDMPLLKRSLELRQRVLGAPAQALDPVAGT